MRYLDDDTRPEAMRKELAELPAAAYVAVWHNRWGEELVFTQQPGSPTAVLYHSDNIAPDRMTVSAPRPATKQDAPGGMVSLLGVDNTDPGILLSVDERLWLTACWLTTDTMREG